MRFSENINESYKETAADSKNLKKNVCLSSKTSKPYHISHMFMADIGFGSFLENLHHHIGEGRR